MFVVTDTYTFTHPVKVLVPTDGGHKAQDFKATFRVMPVDEGEKFDLGTLEGSTGFLRGIVVRLDDLVDDQTPPQPMPYSDALRDKLLRFGFIRKGLHTAYTEAVSKAAEGN